jgi:hypothetical protein
MVQHNAVRQEWLKTRSVKLEGCSEGVGGVYKWTPKLHNGQPIFKKDKIDKKDKNDFMLAMYKVGAILLLGTELTVSYSYLQDDKWNKHGTWVISAKLGKNRTAVTKKGGLVAIQSHGFQLLPYQLGRHWDKENAELSFEDEKSKREAVNCTWKEYLQDVLIWNVTDTVRCTAELAEDKQLDGLEVGPTVYPQMEDVKKLKPIRKKIKEDLAKQAQLLEQARLLEAQVRLMHATHHPPTHWLPLPLSSVI